MTEAPGRKRKKADPSKKLFFDERIKGVPDGHLSLQDAHTNLFE